MLLVFDWDGTLSNSSDKIIRCLQQAAEAAGYRICEDSAIRDIIGLGLSEAMQRLYPELNDGDRKAICQHYVERFVIEDQRPSPFFDEVIEGLHRLHDANFLLAVATGKSRRGLDRVLANVRMQKFFHGSRCADETASKPNPRMLNELLREFAKPAAEAIMMGDTEYDMAMARQADISRVAVSYGVHSIERLKKYSPVLCVDQFSEYVDWIIGHYG